MRPASMFALTDDPKALRVGDLVRLDGSPGVYRIAAVDRRAGRVTLARMSGQPAGTYALDMVRALAGGR